MEGKSVKKMAILESSEKPAALSLKENSLLSSFVGNLNVKLQLQPNFKARF